MTKKHTILTAINSKYIHSNLAVYCLRAYAKPYIDEVEIAEYTINQQVDDILIDRNVTGVQTCALPILNYCRMFQSGLEDQKFPMIPEKF